MNNSLDRKDTVDENPDSIADIAEAIFAEVTDTVEVRVLKPEVENVDSLRRQIAAKVDGSEEVVLAVSEQVESRLSHSRGELLMALLQDSRAGLGIIVSPDRLRSICRELEIWELIILDKSFNEADKLEERLIVLSAMVTQEDKLDFVSLVKKLESACEIAQKLGKQELAVVYAERIVKAHQEDGRYPGRLDEAKARLHFVLEAKTEPEVESLDEAVRLRSELSLLTLIKWEKRAKNNPPAHVPILREMLGRKSVDAPRRRSILLHFLSRSCFYIGDFNGMVEALTEKIQADSEQGEVHNTDKSRERLAEIKPYTGDLDELVMGIDENSSVDAISRIIRRVYFEQSEVHIMRVIEVLGNLNEHEDNIQRTMWHAGKNAMRAARYNYAAYILDEYVKRLKVGRHTQGFIDTARDLRDEACRLAKENDQQPVDSLENLDLEAIKAEIRDPSINPKILFDKLMTLARYYEQAGDEVNAAEYLKQAAVCAESFSLKDPRHQAAIEQANQPTEQSTPAVEVAKPKPKPPVKEAEVPSLELDDNQTSLEKFTTWWKGLEQLLKKWSGKDDISEINEPIAVPKESARAIIEQYESLLSQIDLQEIAEELGKPHVVNMLNKGLKDALYKGKISPRTIKSVTAIVS